METSGFVTKEELFKIIGGIISSRVVKAIEEFVRKNTERGQEFSVLEKVVRVEEELKSLKEIDLRRFETINDSFEALHRETGKSFEGLSRDGQAVLGRWKRGFLLCNDLFWLDLAF